MDPFQAVASMHGRRDAHRSAPSALSFCSAMRAFSGVCLLKVASRMYPTVPPPLLLLLLLPPSLLLLAMLPLLVLVLGCPLLHSCEVTGLKSIFSRVSGTSRSAPCPCGFSVSVTCAASQGGQLPLRSAACV